MKKTVLCIACLTWYVFAASAQGTTKFEAVTDFTAGSLTGYADTAGWTFQPNISIMVTDLGCLAMVVNDYTTVRIGIWSEDQTLLAWRDVGATNLAVGQSYYSSIEPIFLNGGEMYRIGAYSLSGFISLSLVGPPPYLDGSVTLSSVIQLGGYASGTNGFSFPGAFTGTDGSMYLGPNFRYQDVPEPSTIALVLLGAFGVLGWRGFRRHG